MKITAIIPLRISDHVHQARERLERIVRTIPAARYNILIVDYGTPASHQSQLDGLGAANVRVVRHETSGGPFSIGHARDLGVQHAHDPVVLFHDIDFYGSPSMYESIHDEVMAREMGVRAYDFFCVPVFFLTEHGSQAALEVIERGDIPDLRLHRNLFESVPGMVEFPAYGSSAIVANKNHYLGLGGHSREFFGHGAEDYDLLHRLAAHCPKGPRTADYYTDTKSNEVKAYRGFRAFFALYGLDVFARGMFFVHLWHPKRTIPGYHQSRRNFDLLTDLMKRFDKHREQPMPLGDLSLGRRTLILMAPESSSFHAIRHVVPQMGDYEVLPEGDFGNAEEVVDFVRRGRFDAVLLLNPYGNEHRLGIYRALREEGMPFLVFDRGALPDSWFFDDGGFNYDSETYRPDRWDHPLGDEVQAEVSDYLNSLRHGDATLEANGARKTGRYWRERYGVGQRKVLFVPFQRPSDTVTNHFAGAIGSVAQFQVLVQSIVNKLRRSEWVVVCKNHPLDQDLPRIDGAIYAENDVHIHDLLELADKVLLMNSGVGVLALAFGKSVVCTAQAFYQHPGLCHAANGEEEALALIEQELRPDEERVRRFYAHLLHSVYSFGKTTYRKALAADGSHRSIAESIVFRSIRIPGKAAIELGEMPQGVSLDAPLFASFGGREGVKSASSRSPVVKPVAQAPAPASNQVAINSGSRESRPARPAQRREHAPSPLQRKLRKLVRHPRLFFMDLLIKRGLMAH